MSYLTKQEQFVLCVVIGLLLTGWTVRTYRQKHPPSPAEMLRRGDSMLGTVSEPAKP